MFFNNLEYKCNIDCCKFFYEPLPPRMFYLCTCLTVTMVTNGGGWVGRKERVEPRRSSSTDHLRMIIGGAVKIRAKFVCRKEEGGVFFVFLLINLMADNPIFRYFSLLSILLLFFSVRYYLVTRSFCSFVYGYVTVTTMGGGGRRPKDSSSRLRYERIQSVRMCYVNDRKIS